MTPPPPRLARSGRRWLLLAIPALFVGAILVVLRTDAVARLAAGVVETAVEAATGEDLTIGRLHLNYLPVEVSVEGLVLSHRPTGETILATPSLTVTFGVVDWRPAILRLAVDRPRVTLHIDEDGLREFRGLPGGSGPPAEHFPWRELRITDGAFALRTPSVEVDLEGVDSVPVGNRLDLRIGLLAVRFGEIRQEARSISLPGVSVGPGHVDVPSLDLAFDDIAVDGRVRAVQGGPLAADLSVHVDLPGLTSGEDPRKYVDGAVDVDVTLAGTSQAPEISGALSTGGVVIWRLSSADQPVPTRLGDTVGPWRLDGKRLLLGPLEQRWGEGILHVEGEVATDTLETTAVVLAEDVSLASILQATGGAPTPWVDFRGDVEAHVSGNLRPFQLSGPFEVDVSRLLVTNGPVAAGSPEILDVGRGTVLGNLKLDATHIVLDAHDVAVAHRARGRARADIGFASFGPLAVDVRMDRLDLSLLEPLGNARLDGVVSVHGWLGGRFDALSANAELAGTDLVVLGKPIADTFRSHFESADLRRLEFRDAAATLGRTQWRGNVGLAFLDEGMFLDTQVFVPDGWVSDLTGIFLDLPGAEGRVTGTAVLSGGPYELDGEVQLALTEIDLWGEKFEGGHATAWMDGGSFTLEELRIARREEIVLARGSIGRGWKTNLELLADGVTLEGLDHLRGGVPLSGEVAVDARVTGTLFDMEPRGRVALFGVHYGPEPVADSLVRFTTDGEGVLAWTGELAGGALAADGRLALHGTQPYDVRATLREFPVHLLHPRGADGSPVRATLTGTVDLAGHFGDEPIPVDIEARFDAVEATWAGHRLRNPEPWSIAIHGRSVQIPELRLTGDEGTDLRFSGATTADGRTAMRGEGTLALGLLPAFAPGVTAASGTARVEVVIAEEIDVTLKTKGAAVRTEYFPHPIEEISAELVASASGYQFRNFKGSVGGGTLTGSGDIDALDWRPSRYSLDVALRDARVQYLDYLPPIVGDAELRFDGPVDALLLSGDIRIEDMLFRDRIDWESKVLSLRTRRLTEGASKERKNWFSMDLRVTARDTVHFRNNLADADASADLRIVGDTARPGMVGEIRVTPGGRMYLQDREFEVTRGELRYRDPYTFDPDLDILLETDVKGREQDFHVYYAVSGPFSDWRTSTTADPYLSQADINTLLLFGMTREEFERYGGIGAALAAQTTDLLAAQVIDQPIIDRWNLVSGVSERGSTTVSSDLRLVVEKDLAEFTVTGESNFDQDWYVSLERRIAERLFASVYAATRQEGRALDIGGAYGAEFKYRWELD